MSVTCAASCGLDRLARGLSAALERQGDGTKGWELVSNGGCAGYVAGLVSRQAFRVPLGRALPFALGLSSATPDRNVIALIGDGEAAGVGGHHLLQAARRGDRVRAIIVNNEVLEGTGGFPSPTTPRGGRTATLPADARHRPLDLALLARAAGASWVGRETLHGGSALEVLLEEFLTAPPFALLEIRAPCYPSFGRWNGYATPEAMNEALERRAIRGSAGPDEREASFEDQEDGRFRVGRLWRSPDGPA